METKDYATLGIAILALVVSGLSYRLSWLRDRRDTNAKRPFFDIELPSCDGLGPWTAKYKIINHSDIAMFCKYVLVDAGDIGFSIFHENVSVETIKLSRKDRFPSYQVWKINETLEPGSTKEGTIELVSKMKKRIDNAYPVNFYFSYVSRAKPDLAQLFNVKRIANP